MPKFRRGALLDANILLLAISVKVGFHRLRSFSRTQIFVENDIYLLQQVLGDYAHVSTTAYVLAEVSNLANKLSGQLRTDWYRALAEYAVITAEAHVPTSAVGKLPEVSRFGIADAALRQLAESHTVITVDSDFPAACSSWAYMSSTSIICVAPAFQGQRKPHVTLLCF